ncbi:MAG: SPOR domain-containing protein [Pseudomonadota bacterium]
MNPMFEDNQEVNRYPSPRRQINQEGSSDGFFCRFTFGQFFALLILEVFTIFFVFYLGARFGPKILGFNQTAYATQEPIVVGEKPVLKVAKTEDPEVQAMAKDLVKQAETPELKQRLQEILKGPEQPEQPQQYPEEETQPVAEDMPTESVDNTMPFRQVSQVETNSDSDQAAPIRIKSATNSKYALQIGSYQQINEANAMINKLKNRGYPAYLMIADIPDRGRWYRVRLGGFANRDEAMKYKNQLESVEHVETIVVLNEQ